MNDFLSLSVVILWVIVIIQTICIYFLVKFVSTFLNRFRTTGNNLVEETLGVGDKAPLFREYDYIKEEQVAVIDNRGKYTMLMFASKDCLICHELLPKITNFLTKYDLRIIVLSQEELLENINTEISYIKSSNLFEAFNISSVPTMILLDTNNHIVLIKHIDRSFGYNGLSILVENIFRDTKLNRIV